MIGHGIIVVKSSIIRFRSLIAQYSFIQQYNSLSLDLEIIDKSLLNLPKMASQASSQKTRHYAMLASKLKQLQGDLAVTEECMVEMSKQLDSMAKLGAYCGSQ
jgi:hypothetical protein